MDERKLIIRFLRVGGLEFSGILFVDWE